MLLDLAFQVWFAESADNARRQPKLGAALSLAIGAAIAVVAAARATATDAALLCSCIGPPRALRRPLCVQPSQLNSEARN
jgi:hypothetical protein